MNYCFTRMVSTLSTSECPPAHQTLAPSHWPGLLSHRGTSNKKAASRKVEHSALCVCIGHSLLKYLKDPLIPAATVWVLCWCPLPPDPSHPDSWPLHWSSTSTFLLDHHTHYYYSYLPNEKFSQSKYEVSMAAISPVTPLSSPLHHRSLSIPVLKLQSKSFLLLLPD